MRIRRRHSDPPGLGQDAARIPPPLPEMEGEEDSLDSRVARIQQTRVGRGIGAAMIGLGEAIYGPKENQAVEISEAPGAPPRKGGYRVDLSPDGRAIVSLASPTPMPGSDDAHPAQG